MKSLTKLNRNTHMKNSTKVVLYKTPTYEIALPALNGMKTSHILT